MLATPEQCYARPQAPVCPRVCTRISVALLSMEQLGQLFAGRIAGERVNAAWLNIETLGSSIRGESTQNHSMILKYISTQI
jgi:hypothetical protein